VIAARDRAEDCAAPGPGACPSVRADGAGSRPSGSPWRWTERRPDWGDNRANAAGVGRTALLCG
jgi:hypothetical protein